MKNKNIISSILLSTLILSFSLKADEENIDKIFKENIPAKSTGRGKKVLLFLGASSAALATGIGGALVMKFKKDKDLNAKEEELALVNASLEEKMREIKDLNDSIKSKNKMGNELLEENEKLGEQLNKILPKTEMRKDITDLRAAIKQTMDAYKIQSIIPLEEQIQELNDRISQREANAKNLSGDWLEKNKQERAGFAEQIQELELAINSALDKKLERLKEHAKGQVLGKYGVPVFFKIFDEEDALLELQEFVELPK